MGFLGHLRMREKAWKWLQEQTPMWEKLALLESEDSCKWCSTSWDPEQVEERRARQQNVWNRVKSQENDLSSRVWRECARARLPRAGQRGGLCLGKTWAKGSPETPLHVRAPGDGQSRVSACPVGRDRRISPEPACARLQKRWPGWERNQDPAFSNRRMLCLLTGAKGKGNAIQSVKAGTRIWGKWTKKGNKTVMCKIRVCEGRRVAKEFTEEGSDEMGDGNVVWEAQGESCRSMANGQKLTVTHHKILK